MKKIRFYKQHTKETCGISCMLMILDYFGIDYPTVSKEMRLYQMYGTKASVGTLGAAIAYALSRRGLDVSLAHSSEKLMENQGDYYPPQLYEAILKEYRTYIDRAAGAVDVKAGAPIDCGELRRELERDRLVILQCFVEGDADGMHDHVLHGILLYDCDDSCFYACDPLCGKIKLTDAEIDQFMETPLGRMYVSVGQRRENQSAEGG